MYLYKKTYVKNWDHMTPEQKHSISIKRGINERTDIKPERISNIVEEVGYWRKFNALHGYIVNHFGNGEDNCQEIYIHSDDMRNMLNDLKKVWDSKDIPGSNVNEDVLPLTQGFFFGNYDTYDEYYWNELKETIDLFESLLSEPNDGDFYYQASW